MKLYFMLGLPTETDEDVWASRSLADKVVHVWRESAANKARGLRVTVSNFLLYTHSRIRLPVGGAGFSGEYMRRVLSPAGEYARQGSDLQLARRGNQPHRSRALTGGDGALRIGSRPSGEKAAVWSLVGGLSHPALARRSGKSGVEPFLLCRPREGRGRAPSLGTH